MTNRYLSRPPVRDLEPMFRYAREMDPAIWQNAQRHTVLCDPELFAGCGYATHDEAVLLLAIAAKLRRDGSVWVEIGSHTGWTAAHIADAGVDVIAIDPEYGTPVYNQTGDPNRFFMRTRDNVEACGLRYRVSLTPGVSGDWLPKMDGLDGVFVDGDHIAPAPLEDAKMAAAAIRPGGVVVFHDAVGAPVQDAIRWMISAGFKCRIYRTPQLLTVCWRDGFEPPPHDPDPAFDWTGWLSHVVPDDLSRYLDASIR